MADYWGFDQVDVEGLVFVSYNSLDWKRIQPIALELRKRGLPVWYDYGIKVGGEEWEKQINRHVRLSNVMLIFVTKGIFERKNSYVMWEYGKARSLQKSYVPIFLDDVLTDSFYIKWANEQPESFDRYSTNLDRWKAAQGIAFSQDDSPAVIADKIVAKLKHAGISYPFTPWIDQNAVREKMAEEARARAAVEAERERIRQEQEEAKRKKAEIKVGSRVPFGRYPQSSNDHEPIMWRVLDVSNGRALMISEDLLDCKRFDSSSNDWKKSELRKWLNGEFMNKAFNNQEKGALLDYQGDKVTCLSVDEVKKYFSDSRDKDYNYPDRMAKPTALARKNGCYVNPDLGTGCWWLRSPGILSSDAAGVLGGGGIRDYGSSIHNYGCVRPVVFARL